MIDIYGVGLSYCMFCYLWFIDYVVVIIDIRDSEGFIVIYVVVLVIEVDWCEVIDCGLREEV